MHHENPPVVDAPLFFLDYDGTLAPLVDDPMKAYPHAAVGALLDRLEAQYPVWIVTGRHLKDLAQLLGKPLHAVGLHGAQEGTIGGTVESLIPEEAQRVLRALRHALPEVEGLYVEEKGETFAVHYRAVRDEDEARARLTAWLADLPDVLEAVWGKKVLELRPQGISKGTAVRRIAEAHPARTPVYLGDDVTDEDAFEALPGHAVTVKVGEGDTTARYRLREVEDVVSYLGQYV